MAAVSVAAPTHGQHTASACPSCASPMVRAARGRFEALYRTCLGRCVGRRISMDHVVGHPELGNFSSLKGGFPCYVSLTPAPAASNGYNKGPHDETQRPGFQGR